MEALERDEQAALAAVIQRLIDGTTRGGDVKPLGKGVYEVRARVNGVFLRAAYARWGGNYVGLTVFRKKKNRTESQDLERAQERLRTWQASRGREPSGP